MKTAEKPSVNTLAQIQEYSNYWHFYFLRFLVVLWFLVWPCIFALAFWFLKEINKSKKIDITFSQFLIIKKYNYVFHNFTMVCVFCAWIFNTSFIIYTFCDTYILSLDTIYDLIWKIPSDDDTPGYNIKAFFATLTIGYLLHIVSGMYYIYFNLYYTRSRFGEKWRNWIKTNSQCNYKWIRFKKRHQALYEYLYPWIFDVDKIEKYDENLKIAVIDD